MDESGIHLRLLGPVEVRSGGAGRVPLAPRPRLLLSALALNGPSVMPFAQLTEVLWDDQPPPSARANLRSYAAAVRSALATGGFGRLCRHDYGYTLTVAPGEVDADLFATMVGRAESALLDGDLPGAAVLLEQALALWRGSAGEGLPHAPALAGRLDALAEQRLVAQETLIETRLALGGHRAQIPVLRTLLAAHPLRERCWAALIRARYAIGDTAGALAAYRQCREELGRQLGVEPGAELTLLHRAVLNRDLVGLGLASAVARPGVPVAARATHQADQPVRSGLAGRETVLDELRSLLRVAAADGSAPVVVVHGPVGVGSSALCRQALAGLTATFPDGCRCIDLDDDRSGTPRPVPPWLPGQRGVLLVEHATTAAEVRALTQVPAGCAVLVTSGGPLGAVDRARRLRVPRLPEPVGVELLAAQLGARRVADEMAAARRLVHWCAGLPLPLRACAAYLLARPDEAIAVLADRLADLRARLDLVTVDDLDIRARLAGRYRLVCARDPLGTALTGELSRLCSSTVDSRVVAGALGLAPSAVEPSLDRFTEHGLLSFDGDSGRYRIDALAQLVAVELAADADLGMTGPGRAGRPEADRAAGVGLTVLRPGTARRLRGLSPWAGPRSS